MFQNPPQEKPLAEFLEAAWPETFEIDGSNVRLSFNDAAAGSTYMLLNTALQSQFQCRAEGILFTYSFWRSKHKPCAKIRYFYNPAKWYAHLNVSFVYFCRGSIVLQ